MKNIQIYATNKYIDTIWSIYIDQPPTVRVVQGAVVIITLRLIQSWENTFFIPLNYFCFFHFPLHSLCVIEYAWYIDFLHAYFHHLLSLYGLCAIYNEHYYVYAIIFSIYYKYYICTYIVMFCIGQNSWFFEHYLIIMFFFLHSIINIKT